MPFSRLDIIIILVDDDVPYTRFSLVPFVSTVTKLKLKPLGFRAGIAAIRRGRAAATVVV